MKSSGGNIAAMNVAKGQDRSAKVIRYVAGQGPIYLRALVEIPDENMHNYLH